MGLSRKILLNVPTTPGAYGAIVDISQFISAYVYSDITAFSGSYNLAFYMDLADALANNFQAGTGSITAPFIGQALNAPTGVGGMGHFAGLRIYCNSYSSGTPTFWLLGRYA